MEIPEYLVRMQDGEYLASVYNSKVMRFDPPLMIDHLEVITKVGVIAAYNCLPLLDEMEEQGWPTQHNGFPDEKEITIAEQYFQAEIEHTCEYDLW